MRRLINTIHMISRVVSLSALLLIVPMPAFSAVPADISYSGLISDSGGLPITGTVNLVFNIYEDANNDGAADGASIWSETHNSVSVTSGVFNVRLGSVGGVLGGLDFDIPYLLGITVGADAEMTPLLRFSSVPSSFRVREPGAEFVDCTTVPGGGKIQAAVNSGASPIIINGVCEEAVVISRDSVVLIAEGSGTDGITGPSDDQPALKYVGASFNAVFGLTIAEAAGSTDEACIQLLAGSDVGFFGITVPDCPDIGVDVLFNSSANFNIDTGVSNLNSITGAVVGVEVSAGANLAMAHTTISNFSEDGLVVAGNSFAFAGDAGNGGVTITSAVSGARAVLVEGSSSVELEGVSITSTNGSGVYVSGSSSLQALDGDGGAGNSISAEEVGVFVFSGTIEIEDSSIVVSDGSAIEIHNNSTAIIKDTSTLTGTGSTGSDYGVECFSNAVLNTPVNPNITGTDGITNSGSTFCSVPVPPPPT